MGEKRAFEVRRGDEPAGHLGEGAGPFIFASDALGGYPHFEFARFTCFDEEHEAEVGRAFEQAGSFDALIELLRAGGYELLPVVYDRVFQPAQSTPVAAPGAVEELRQSLAYTNDGEDELDEKDASSP